MMKTMNMPSKIETRQSKPGEGNARRAILHPPSSILNPRHRGFSFAEVMFAVVILGIGFIMVAAVFPVAIQQTQATGEENIAAALARQAADSVGQLFASSTIPNPVYNSKALQTDPPSTKLPFQYLFPPTAKNYVLGTGPNAVPPASIVVPFVGSRWDLIKSNVILPTDPRYAYLMFYKRDNGSSVAQAIIVAVAARNRPTYQPNVDLFSYSSPSTATITTLTSDFPAAQAHTVVCPDTLTVTGASSPIPEGTTLQLPITSSSGGAIPLGRSYAVGRSVDVSSWEMMPVDNMALTAGTNGLWGTAGRTADVPCSSTTAAINPPATLQPTVAYATLFTTTDAPQGRILLNLGPVHSGTAVPAAAVQGAYVIIADDFPPLPGMQSVNGGKADYALQPNIPGTYTVGAMNGRIFRLGALVPTSTTVEPGTFNLDPAFGMRPIPPGGSASPDTIPNSAMVTAARNNGDPDAVVLGGNASAKVYIIGAGRTSPTTPGDTSVSGPAQDIGVFASFFQVQ